jgi:hypothetical protein
MQLLDPSSGDELARWPWPDIHDLKFEKPLDAEDMEMFVVTFGKHDFVFEINDGDTMREYFEEGMGGNEAEELTDLTTDFEVFTMSDPTETLPEELAMKVTGDGITIADEDGTELLSISWAEVSDHKASPSDDPDELDVFVLEHTEFGIFHFECIDSVDLQDSFSKLRPLLEDEEDLEAISDGGPVSRRRLSVYLEKEHKLKRGTKKAKRSRRATDDERKRIKEEARAREEAEQRRILFDKETMERELEDMAAEEKEKRDYDEADLERTLGHMLSLKSLFVCGLVEAKEELMPSLEIITIDLEHTKDTKNDEEGSKHLGFHFEVNDDGAPEITEVVEGGPAAGEDEDDENKLCSLDILYEVNGTAVHDLRVGNVDKMLAKDDDEVTIAVIREKAGQDEDEIPEEFKALMEAAGIAEEEGEGKDGEAANLDEGDLKLAADVFQIFDLDGGGTLDKEELNTALQILGCQDIDKTIRELDDDGSGSVSFSEWEEWFKERLSDAQKAAHREAAEKIKKQKGDGDEKAKKVKKSKR